MDILLHSLPNTIQILHANWKKTKLFPRQFPRSEVCVSQNIFSSQEFQMSPSTVLICFQAWG